MTIDLDERCLDMLKRLLNQDYFLRIQDIANDNNISKRSVYYDLCKINDFLDSQDIDPVTVERNKGMLLSSKQRKSISALMDGVNHTSTHVFSPMERVSIIICTIINRNKNLFIEDFMNITQVSRNTTINDLRATGSKLKEYNLELNYENGQGYRILGDVIRKRAMFFMFFIDIAKYYQNGTLPVNDMRAVRNNLVKLRHIERKLETRYVEGTLFALAFFIPKMERSKDELESLDIDKEMLMKSKEFTLVSYGFPILNNSERIYLSLHLLGSRVQTTPIDDVIIEEDTEAYELAKALVSEFQRIACVEFENKEDIERNLFAHIKTSLYRYRYGIQLGNPLLDDIKVQYPELFEITKKAVDYWNQQIGVPINDSEIAYLTLHFGGAMQEAKSNSDTMRILIVCPNGISTGNMLRGEVSSLVPHADKVDVHNMERIDELVDDYDIFITTVPLSIKKRWLLVHPILTDADRIQIMKRCIRQDVGPKVDVNALMKRIEPFVKENSENQLRKEIEDFFQEGMAVTYSPLRNTDAWLKDYLNPEHICYINREIDWRKAIKISGAILVDNGDIESRYLDAIIAQCENYGPYMFISDNVVLAHAKIEDGVNHLGLSIGVFPEGVEFEDDRVAKIIFVLAAEDQVKHLKILRDLMDVFSVPGVINELMQCFDEDSFINNMRDILNEYSTYDFK